jgi:hypothetical protein
MRFYLASIEFQPEPTPRGVIERRRKFWGELNGELEAIGGEIGCEYVELGGPQTVLVIKCDKPLGEVVSLFATWAPYASVHVHEAVPIEQYLDLLEAAATQTAGKPTGRG